MAQHLFQRRPNHSYPVIQRGQGPYLFDQDGNKYFDAVGGAGVACLGHGLKEMGTTLGHFIQDSGYLHGMQFTSKVIEEYSDELMAHAPIGLSKIQFMGSGSEAIEAALKLAYQFFLSKYGNHRKNKFLYTRPGYHGSTLLALSISGKARDQESYQSLLQEHPSIPLPACQRCPYQLQRESCDLHCTRELEKAILHHGPENLAAYVIEPIGGASSGVAILPDDYLRKAKEICARHDLLLIFDEVMCGYGRSGKWFACDHYGISPDILTLGKGMAGGLFPLAGLLCSEEVYQTVVDKQGSFKHGHTFTNHLLAIKAAQLVYRTIVQEDLLSNVQDRGTQLAEGLHALKARNPLIGEVRGKGLLLAFDLVMDGQPGKFFPRSFQMAEKVVGTAMKEGLNLYFSTEFKANREGDAILIMPPYNLTKAQAEELIDRLERVLAKVCQDHNNEAEKSI